MRHARSATLATATLLIAANAIAQAPIKFFEGGYPQLCALAAKNELPADATAITGSKLNIPPLELCTLAIIDTESTLEQRASSFNNRGVLRFAQGDRDGAMADFDAAVRLQDSLGQAHANRGYAFNARRRWREALADLDRAVELGTDEPARVYFNRAVAHEELRQVREAYLDYRKASELQPEWDDPKRELARFTVRNR